MATRRDFLTTGLVATGAFALPARLVRAAQSVRFDVNPFPLGIASGYPTPDSMVLWTRLALSPLEPGGGKPPEVLPVNWEIAAGGRGGAGGRRGAADAAPE